MKFTLPFVAYNSSQLTTRNILKHSKNPEIRDLYKATAPKNIVPDTLLHQDKPKNPEDRLVNITLNKILDNMKDLKNKIPSLIPSHSNVHVRSINGGKFVKDFHKTSLFSSVNQ